MCTDNETRSLERDGDALDVFRALEVERIRYVIWKDVPELAHYRDGDGELDLLVHDADLGRLRNVARQQGYGEYRHHLDIYGGAITHLIRFSEGRYYHLHVHTALLTGDHCAKEFDLTSLFDDGLFASPHVGGARIVSAESEYTIGVVRLVLKAASPSGIKLNELERLRALHCPALWKAALERIARRVPLSEDAANALLAVMEGEDGRLVELARFLPLFDGLRRLGRFDAFEARWRLRIADAIAGLFGLSNKVMTERAPTVAIMGPDGSGKTTLCDALERTLRKKISIARIYLGSNAETYGPFARLAHLAHGAIGRARRVLPGSAFPSDLYNLSLAVLEYAKCRDRVRRIRRGRRLAVRGVVVLFERYPVVGLYDSPTLGARIERGEVRLGRLVAAPVRGLLTRIERLLEAEAWPDVALLCSVDYGRIASRRRLRPDEEKDIRRKLALLRDYVPREGDDLQIVANDGRLSDTLARVFAEVNETLCSRSS